MMCLTYLELTFKNEFQATFFEDFAEILLKVLRKKYINLKNLRRILKKKILINLIGDQ